MSFPPDSFKLDPVSSKVSTVPGTLTGTLNDQRSMIDNFRLLWAEKRHYA